MSGEPSAFVLIALTIITAATPLVFAAIGELVTERSGVLNLGVEGMMLTGAVSSFLCVHVWLTHIEFTSVTSCYRVGVNHFWYRSISVGWPVVNRCGLRGAAKSSHTGFVRNTDDWPITVSA